MTKPRQYRLQNIPTDVWTMVKDIQRTMEQRLGKSVTFELAFYELVRVLYGKVSSYNIQNAKNKKRKTEKIIKEVSVRPVSEGKRLT